MKALYQPFQPLLSYSGLQNFELSLLQSPADSRLQGVVHSYLQITTAKATPYPVLPDGTQAVFISPDGTRISGAQSQTLNIQILHPGEYFGIRFYPGALRHFFKLNLSEITDQLVDSRYFSDKIFSQLHKVIYLSQDFKQRAAVCDGWLQKLYNPQPLSVFDHALKLIYQSYGNLKVSQLAATIGLSSRHLNRLFQQYIGLSTKTFILTIRIQTACKKLSTTPKQTLQTAFELGYFDQAHLLNDYKKRLLLTPNSLFEKFMSDFYNSEILY